MNDCLPGPVFEMQQAFEVLGGKWKMLILSHLAQQPRHRFGELKARIPAISQRVLTLQLRQLEHAGLVTRHAFAEAPPRVEYAITAKALGLQGVFEAIAAWRARFAA